MKNCGVYKITNIANGKFYIGSSWNGKGRWVNHRSRLRHQSHSNPFLQKAWNKYGEENFTFEIIECCERDALLKREQHHLDTKRPFRGTGYNISQIAGGGDIFSSLSEKEQKEFREKSSHFGKENGMFGQEHTDETKQKLKNKAKGRFSLDWFIERNGDTLGKKKYEERREKLANRKINYVHDNKCSGKKRRPLTDEEKQKISFCKLRMKTIEADLKKAILSQKFTVREIQEKFQISKLTTLSRKRKYLRFDPTT